MLPRIIARSEHSISRKRIDPDALKVLYRLYRSGHTAFLVGGGVRDLLLGRAPKDFDISTSARPGQVKKLFRNCWLIGRRFRLAHIHFRDQKIVEVSTFRAEPQRDASEGDEDLLVRQDNTFGTPEEDALRRDFTINGLFYDIASFSIIDYVGGVDDIERGVIRTIGDPRIRFQEDPVRMLRAIKFAARLDFSIDPDTWDALCEHAEDIRKSSQARVQEEIARLTEGGGLCRSVQLLKASGLLSILLPEVYEYLQGVPAGPGFLATAQAALTDDATEVEVLLHADEDADLAVQEHIFAQGAEHSALDADPVGAEPLQEAAEPVEEDTIELPVSDGDAQGVEPLECGESQVLVSRSEGEADEEIVLDDDAEASLTVLTEEGLRCPQAPDRGALLWRTLSAVDLLIREGRTLTRSTVFAAMYSPLLQHTAQWRSQREGGSPNSYVLGLLKPLTSSLAITRRDRERVCQMLAAQGRFERSPQQAMPPVARKPYFPEALDLFEIATLAEARGLGVLASWRELFPPVVLPKVLGRVTQPPVLDLGDAAEGRAGRRSRRRRGGRNRDERGDGGALTSTASEVRSLIEDTPRDVSPIGRAKEPEVYDGDANHEGSGRASEAVDPAESGGRRRRRRRGEAGREASREGRERPVKEEREPRSGQREREEREPRGDRGPREERESRGERRPREEREPRGDRGPREEREPRGDRRPREEREPRGDRGPREEREPHGDRGPREEREPHGDRRPREERESRGERRPREEREPRGDRRPREEREPRSDQREPEDRELRGDQRPREERESRGDRRPREEREPRGDRRPREEREPRDERRPREEREPRSDRRLREEREPRSDHRPREEREPRGERQFSSDLEDRSSRLSRRPGRGRNSSKMSDRVGGDLTADSAPPPREEVVRRRRRRPPTANR